ncbi:S24 family peptidase [Clostridium cellulovorans]|uniref:Peptidase S24/S26A/S26B, conserved region n=1 Tax=Clostridium cellulovorans (strain ATCC 35296 / DSM 3052 / OCM 3 / 743B) TaxID=573061 RepID=D9SS52_CLOC7|nr:S24 family peptidase [Clostridium cellulovorans]ADL52499.1 Peptidase S24/S26A/S26B, conserved region [Clostridium cellulovorans 743B]
MKRFVTSKPVKLTIIKGPSGTGKTTLAILRLSYLLNNYCQEDKDSAILITRNRLLRGYARYIYEGISGNGQLTLFSLLNIEKEILTLEGLKNLIIKKVFSSGYKVIKTKEEEIGFLKKAIDEIKLKFKKSKLLKDYQYIDFILEEINFINSEGISSLEVYQNVKRYRNIPYPENIKKFVLRKNSLGREVIYRINEAFNEITKSQGYIKKEAKTNLAISLAIENNIKFTHIIIDDIDKFTRSELELIKVLASEKQHSTVTLTSRNRKAVLPYSYLGKGRTLKAIDLQGKTILLKDSYRTNKSICDFAESLMEKGKSRNTLLKSSLVSGIGEYPIHRNFSLEKEEYLYIARLIKEELTRKNKYKDITILIKEHHYLERLKMFFYSNQIPYVFLDGKEFESNKEAVRISTYDIYSGLENRITIICGVNESSYNREEHRRFLYDQILSTKEKLYITSSGKPSIFLDEVSPKLFKIDDRQYSDKGLEHYTFLDFTRDKRIELIKDITLSKNLSIKSEDSYVDVEESELKRIPVFNNIAAGSPILINEEESDGFFLPKAFLKNNKEFFMLKVSGDSMINANLNNEDYVIIERSAQVDNMQIAAVAIGEEATLKRIKIKGNSVTLISENQNYPPMMVHSKDVRILGNAVGVIKKR